MCYHPDHLNQIIDGLGTFEAVVAHNPFRDEAENDSAPLVVMFLKSAPNRKDHGTARNWNTVLKLAASANQ